MPDSSQQIRLTFTDLAYGGDAVGRDPDSGMAVFAWPAISGEEATVDVVTREKNLLRGTVAALHKVSPDRVTPPCPYFGSCGGCQWQHLDYPAQVAAKHAILRSQLQRFGGISDPDAVLLQPIAAPSEWGYRNTSHFALQLASRSLGYYRRDTRSVVPIENCPISNAGVNRAIPLVNRILEAAVDPSHPGFDTHGLMAVWKVTIRSGEATGQTLVIFHSRPGGRAQARHQPRRKAQPRRSDRPDVGPNMDAQPDNTDVLLISRRAVRTFVRALSRESGELGAEAIQIIEVMDDGTINLLVETRTSGTAAGDALADAMVGASLGKGLGRSTAGQATEPSGSWIERLGGHAYWVAPEAFFQVNTACAELLLGEVAAALPGQLDLLVDAHAGVGTFALAFAGRSRSVLALELDAGAVASGRFTALAQGTTNVEFRVGRAETLLRALPDNQRPDAVILDPPRSGCHPALLEELRRRAVPRLAYVSCDPSTLARDIGILSPDYALTSARVLDMFPQTYHLETLAVLDHAD